MVTALTDSIAMALAIVCLRLDVAILSAADKPAKLTAG